MILVLSLILFILLIWTARLRGFKSFICLYINYFLIILYVIFMGFGSNAIILAIITCFISSLVMLFLLNGINIKTKSSFISVIIIILITTILISVVSYFSNINGFSSEEYESIVPYSFAINYNMTNVIIGMYLISTIGTVIDTSISISSALNEVYENNKNIKFKELFKSGMNIGKDILSTTINTLYFAFFGSFIGFFFIHYSSEISLIINNKLFIQEVLELLFCFISSILIIPITSYIFSKKITNFKKN